MKYDFTTAPDRKKIASYKWKLMEDWNANVDDDVVPLSVADMDLLNAPEIIDGLKKYLDDVVLGYSLPYQKYLESVKNWLKKRHNFIIENESILPCPGVVNGFLAGLRALTKKGDGVLIFTPVYNPMRLAIKSCELREVAIPLLNENCTYTIDFEKFEKMAKCEENTVLLFCSPHNPVSRVWSKDELIRIATICKQNNVKIISDEIWSDLVMPPHKHTVFASVDKEILNDIIMCTSPSKSFNIAGMSVANLIIANEDMREKVRQELVKARNSSVNILGFKACELAYSEAEAWLEEVLKLIYSNIKICEDFFDRLGMNYSKTEGTYLFWVDFKKLGLSKYELEKFLHEEAQFFTDEGYIFGDEGTGYERINLALPTKNLKIQLEKLQTALALKFPEKFKK